MNVREKIIAAFSETPPPMEGDVSVPTYDDEGTAEYFTGKTWQGHSVETLRWYSSSLTFFSPSAFRYFLPAYMLAELDDPNTADVIAGAILFHFTSGPTDEERLRHFTREELEAIAAFFDECE